MNERVRKYLHAVAGTGPILPLLLLTAIYFFDEFDTQAFAVLAPNIEKAFGLTDREFGNLVVANISFVLLLAIPIGYLGDRVSRRNVTVVCGLLAGVFSALTGVAGGVGFLVAVRIGNGIGNLANGTIHNSLLSDLHTPDERPRVFGWHQNALYVGQIAGSAVAGILASAFGWRWAFIPLVLPIAGVTLYALKIKDPVRGATDDPGSAEALEADDPVPFREAARVLWAVPTLKRQYIAFAFVGAGIIPLAFLLPLYYERVFGIGALGRGFIFSLYAGCTLIGVNFASKRTPGWFALGMGEPLKRCGLLFIGLAAGLVATSLVPGKTVLLPLAMLFSCITSFIAGFFYPPFLSTQALVSPARVRTLSFSFGSLFLVAGVFFLWALPGVSAVSDDSGIRWGVAVLAPYLVIGGLILASSGRFVEKDTMQALSNMATTLSLKAERRQAGEQSLLVCRGVQVAYGQTQVLFGVDLDVRKGEILALLGTNGAGKSTLLKAVVGSLPPIGGAVFFDGKDITRQNAPDVAALGVAMVPGGKGTFPTLTVEENFELAGWLVRKDKAHLEKARRKAFDYFPILEERWTQKAGNLSGGEQQMCLIGMALLGDPKLLIIDELSLGLSPLIVERLLEVVRKINDEGVTVVLVEQSVNVALTLADRAVFLEKGEVRFDGPTGELLDRPDILRSVFLEGASAGEDGSIPDPSSSGPKAPAIVKLPFEIPHDRKGRPRPPILEVRDLSVAFGGIKAVNNVDLDVHAGQIVGLIGPNGAGKTTIFDLVSGFLVPTSGSITLDGTDVTKFTPDARARRALGRSFQDARLFPSMTVKETIATAFERHLRVKDPVAAALASPATRAMEREIADKVEHLVTLMRLSAFANKFIGELSTGSRRIVDLACTVAHDPIVLLLDEPSSGIAQRETEALGPLLLDIRDETGAALIVIEHDMPLITGISDEIVALELGAVMMKGTPEEVMADPHVVASYLGTTEATINRSGDAGMALAGRQVAEAAASTNGGTATATATRRRSSPSNGDGPTSPRTPRVRANGTGNGNGNGRANGNGNGNGHGSGEPLDLTVFAPAPDDAAVPEVPVRRPRRTADGSRRPLTAPDRAAAPGPVDKPAPRPRQRPKP